MTQAGSGGFPHTLVVTAQLSELIGSSSFAKRDPRKGAFAALFPVTEFAMPNWLEN